MRDIDKGIFTISLDFELYWGMKDVVSIATYEPNLKGTPQAVEEMLRLFDQYNIHVTWSTIGFLFCRDLDELKRYYPKILPKYKDKEIDLYRYIDENPDLKNEYHFAPQSIKKIQSYENQEISTHTFSHYYCLEEGQGKEAFYEDLKAAKRIAEKFNIELRSLVFPRNQYNQEYIEAIKDIGIVSYRGNEKGWMYEALSEKEKKTVAKRLLRILDSYINLSGHHTYKLDDIKKEFPYNIPASRFLRPYSKKLSFLDSFRLKRIKESMNHAAKNGELFHLWWHPHNFGVYTEENMEFLEKILKHYKFLEGKYGFRSKNMSEVSRTVIAYGKEQI